MSSNHLFIVLTYVIWASVLALSEGADRTCQKLDECSCKFTDTGGVVNIRNLASLNGLAAFPDMYGQDGFQYSYNPCVPFSEDECVDSAICKIRPGYNATSETIADHKEVSFNYDGHSIQVAYVHSQGLTSVSFVSFVCVEHLFNPKFTAFGRNGTDPNYYFQVETMCACEGGCPLPEVDEGLTAGSVILIIFFVLVGMYLILGTIHGRVVRHASGLEQLPNYEFWVALPGHIRNGCVAFITCSCFGTPKKTYDEV